jgi:hypothetical protein
MFRRTQLAQAGKVAAAAGNRMNIANQLAPYCLGASVVGSTMFFWTLNGNKNRFEAEHGKH